MHRSLPIGDFSRATLLSIKTLRHYQRIGLLDPAGVDPGTGHRRYTADQIPAAQVIRRLRSLDMPLEEISAVISAADLGTRNDLISSHLRRLEAALERARRAAASLRDLLQPPADPDPVEIERRQVPATPAAAVRDTLDLEDFASWFQGALRELYAAIAAQELTPAGHAGGIFATGLFTHERGEATVYVPCANPVRPTGRVAPLTVPAVEVAVITHTGSRHDADRAYGSLGSYVAEHALAAGGPLREFYVVGARDTADEERWRTEIGWPISRTGPGT